MQVKNSNEFIYHFEINMNKQSKMSDRLFVVRKILGFNQGDFARKLETTQGHISNMENGRREISVEIALILNELFSISVEWLLMGRGEMRKPVTSTQDFTEKKSDTLDSESIMTERKSCFPCIEKDILIKSLREIIEVQKNNLESKDATIDAFREALAQAKARLEERGPESIKKI